MVKTMDDNDSILFDYFEYIEEYNPDFTIKPENREKQLKRLDPNKEYREARDRYARHMDCKRHHELMLTCYSYRSNMEEVFFTTNHTTTKTSYDCTRTTNTHEVTNKPRNVFKKRKLKTKKTIQVQCLLTGSPLQRAINAHIKNTTSKRLKAATST